MYNEAEPTLLKAREVRPNAPPVYTTLAGYYNRQGEFDKTIEALEARATLEPENPEAFHTIATYYWDKAFRDPRLTDPEKSVLPGVRANREKAPKLQKELLAEADRLRDRAIELQKKKTAGIGD